MVNKTDYYTGIIIKGYIRDYGEAVLSGGRYDKLISEFGYDVPATGFAINVDAVAKVISKTEKFSVKIPDVIVFSNKEFYIKAFDIAKKYREEGLVTEIALFDNIDDVREYAKEKQIQKIVLVNENVTEVN
jgi:ATP phosphoribosyltransferase regulatory subunit